MVDIYQMSGTSAKLKWVTHDDFTKRHSTDLKEWHKVKHMLTLKRDPETCKQYVFEAASALLEYNQIALQKDAEFPTETIHEKVEPEENWHPLLGDITEMLRKGTSTEPLDPEQQQTLERSNEESAKAAEELLQGEEEELEAAERKRQKRKEKKGRKATKSKDSDDEGPRHTVILVNYVHHWNLKRLRS